MQNYQFGVDGNGREDFDQAKATTFDSDFLTHGEREDRSFLFFVLY